MESTVTNAPRLIALFEESEDATQEARRLAERDRDYYDHKQLTPKEEKELESRGQPAVIYNRIQAKADYIFGLEKQLRKDPKAFPRTPGDEGAASAATDAVRFVCDDCDYDARRSEGMENLYIEGIGAIMVGAKKVRTGIDPDLIWIPWDRFFFDPHSRKVDFSDAEYMGFVTWYDLDTAKAKWPDKAEILEQTVEDCRAEPTYDDRPKWRMWADYKRKRVRVVEGYYLVNGVWHMCIATKSGELSPAVVSPYLDEQGEPENPIKAVSYYVDRDNARYGGVRGMISPQDEINKRRSKGLHLITMRQSRVSRSAGMEPEEVRKQLAKPDGVVVGEKDEFEVLSTGDMASANMAMLQEAKSELDSRGPNAALAGKNEATMSGRAIIAQQQGGMVEANNLFDRLRILNLAVYRAIWCRIRQYWTAERWIRVTDNERNIRFVGLNQPVTVQQLAQEAMRGDQAALATASRFIPPQVMQAAMQGDQQAQLRIAIFVRANASQVVEVRNQVAELDVDITIDEGVDTPTVQAEQFDTLAKIMPGLTNLPPLYAKLLIQSSSLRDKDKLLEMLDQPPPPEQAQAQQASQQLSMAAAQADIEKTRSETERNRAAAQGEQVRSAETMMNAQREAMPPQIVAPARL